MQEYFARFLPFLKGATFLLAPWRSHEPSRFFAQHFQQRTLVHLRDSTGAHESINVRVIPVDPFFGWKEKSQSPSWESPPTKELATWKQKWTVESESGKQSSSVGQSEAEGGAEGRNNCSAETTNCFHPLFQQSTVCHWPFRREKRERRRSSG